MHRQPGVGGPHSSTGTILRRGGRQILPGAGVHYSGQPASPHCMTLRGRTAWHTPRARGLAGGREGAPNPKLGINARTRHKRHFPASAGAPRTKSLRDFPRGVCGARSVHGNAQALRAWSVGRAHKRSAPGQSTRGFVHGPFRARPKARRAWSVHGGDRALHQYFKGGDFQTSFSARGDALQQPPVMNAFAGSVRATRWLQAEPRSRASSSCATRVPRAILGPLNGGSAGAVRNYIQKMAVRNKANYSSADPRAQNIFAALAGRPAGRGGFITSARRPSFFFEIFSRNL
jgi:hypothetical protein